MLAIRLLRIGKKHQPSYKIVVTDKKNPPRGGRFADQVGSWNPLTKQRILKGDKIKEWISKGAKPSDTVYNMLIEEKIIEGEKIKVNKKSKKPPIQEVPKSEPSSQEGAEVKEKASEDSVKAEEKKEESEEIKEPSQSEEKKEEEPEKSEEKQDEKDLEKKD